MKKVLSVLLALVMMFSLMNVAFATAEDSAAADSTTVEATEEEKGFEDIPLWQLKIGVKLAKIVLKIVKIFAKLGFIDLSGIIEQLQSYIEGALNPAEPEAPATTVVAA